MIIIMEELGISWFEIMSLLLSGEIQGKGMLVPFNKEIYRPILKRLEHEGIISTERVIHH